jgi:hypothetical protein
MWFWIGVGLGSFICVAVLVTFVFARILGALNSGLIELLEYRVPASCRSSASAPRPPTSHVVQGPLRCARRSAEPQESVDA